MNGAEILALALVLDAVLGEPGWLWSRLHHPAAIMGRLVDTLDTALNTGQGRKAKGAIMLFGLFLAAWLTGMMLVAIPDFGVIEVLVTAILLAQKSLCQHVGAVADALRLTPSDGRMAVARIVGRDTSGMDAPAIARAAIESAAENLSDGVIAPAFWFLLLGLPGLLVYKIVNTSDSMIGYRTDRHRDFGWASARLDDALNWIPARLTALLIAITHLRLGTWPLIRRDASLHRSPNAGWPEAAMAQVLGVALAGPRSYDGEMRNFPFVNAAGRRDAGPDDIDSAIEVLWRVWRTLLAITLLLALVC